jgi:hypothetical protein
MPDITLKFFAQKMGVSPSMITKARKAGILDAALVKVNGQTRVKINLAKGKKLYNQNLDPNFRKAEQKKRGQQNRKKGAAPSVKKKTAEKKPAAGKKDSTTYLSSRAALEKYKALDKQLAFEIKQGMWIEKEVVQSQLFKISRICRDTLMNIPARTSALVAAHSKKKKGKVFEIIHREVKESIDEFIKQITKI